MSPIKLVSITAAIVKATPVFNAELCDKLGVEPLGFDGENDAVFQESDKEGNPFMEYIEDHGTFVDVPLDKITLGMKTHYPHFFEKKISRKWVKDRSTVFQKSNGRKNHC